MSWVHVREGVACRYENGTLLLPEFDKLTVEYHRPVPAEFQHASAAEALASPVLPPLPDNVAWFVRKDWYGNYVVEFHIGTRVCGPGPDYERGRYFSGDTWYADPRSWEEIQADPTKPVFGNMCLVGGSDNSASLLPTELYRTKEEAEAKLQELNADAVRRRSFLRGRQVSILIVTAREPQAETKQTPQVALTGSSGVGGSFAQDAVTAVYTALETLQAATGDTDPGADDGFCEHFS